MRYYAKLGTTKLMDPPSNQFSITEILNGIAFFEYIIQNTSTNRSTLASKLTEDFTICRVSDDLVLLTGSIDSNSIEYFSENEASPDRIRLSGFGSYVDLAYPLFKRLADADASNVDKVFDLDASGPAYTDYTTAANNDTIDDVLLTFGAVEDALYIGQDETFSIVKTKYSTKGVYDATVVWEYWNGSAWVALDTLDAITYIDESRGFTKDPGTYYLVLSGKPSDWAKNAVNSVEKYWIRLRISAWTSTTTAPKLDRIWIGDTDIYRVQFDNIAADTILGYVLDSTDYSEDATDQCPADLISMRMEYESRLRCAFGIAKALTWDDGGNKKPYDCWITTDKKVHFKQQRGSSKGDISADLAMLDNAESYQGIGNRIFGLGSFDGINQRRAIVENQTSQDSYSLREIPLKDLRFSHETSLKELIQKHLTDSKAPLKEVSCEIKTKYWLDNSFSVGDEITIDQPDWNVSAQTYRIMQAVIGPGRTTLDLGIQQTHLENIRSVLQRQVDIADVWMAGATNIYQVGPLLDNFERVDNTTVFPLTLKIFIPDEAKFINHVKLNWKLDNYRADSTVAQSKDLGTKTSSTGATKLTMCGIPFTQEGINYGAAIIFLTTTIPNISGTFYSHIYLYSILNRSGGNRTYTYELKDITDNNIIDSGSKSLNNGDYWVWWYIDYTERKGNTLRWQHNQTWGAGDHDLIELKAYTTIKHDHNVVLGSHDHNLNYGIQEDSDASPIMELKVNGTTVGNNYSGDQNDITITDYINKGWNTIILQPKVGENKRGRAQLDGIVQVFIESK